MRKKTLGVLSVCNSDAGGGAPRAAYRIHQGVQQLGVNSRMLVHYKHTSDENVIPLDAFAPHNSFYQTFDWVRNKCKNKVQHALWNRYPEREAVLCLICVERLCMVPCVSWIMTYCTCIGLTNVLSL